MRAVGAAWLTGFTLLLSACSESHPGSLECGSYDPPCAADSVEWTDEHCFMSDASPEERCDPRGDGLCYQRCITDADCADPCRPYCGEIGFFMSSPFICAPPGYVVRVCREHSRGACEI